jgi:D-xylose transport system ATP-binding protein
MGLIDSEVMLERASALLSEFDIDLDLQRPMGQLGMPMRQVVEIAKALAKRARILILDEPTSALTPHEARVLFGHMRRLRKNGVTCIFISHRIGEVLEVADRATVLRDGQVIDTVETASTTPSQLIAKMIGRDLRDLFPARSHEIGPPILEVGKLTIAHPDQPHRPLVDGVTFELRRGEILGLFGLIGAGRTELVTALFGAWRGGYTGEIHVRGQPASITTPTDAIRYGLGLLTEDRQLSVIFSMGIAPNISLASLDRLCRWSLIDEAGERGLAETFIEALSIRAPSLATPVRHLSGGNQQKVVLSRWLAIDPQVLIMDEPTKGVDIGAKAEIFGIMRRLTERGIGIILISSELPEILGMSDRVLVMFEGKAVAEFVTATASEDQIMTYATGGTPGASI